MFNGQPEVQKGATQALIDAMVYLRRASDSLGAVQPLFSNNEFRERIKQTRKLLEQEALWLDTRFQIAAEEYFR